jgi:hypothetical protein
MSRWWRNLRLRLARWLAPGDELFPPTQEEDREPPSVRYHQRRQLEIAASLDALRWQAAAIQRRKERRG